MATSRCSGRIPKLGELFGFTAGLAALAARLVLLAGLIALTGLACVAPPPQAGQAADPTSVLELHFFDVGQGDAVLIRAPGGRAVLYDGGEDGGRLLGHLERAGVTSLELVIASHNHADHIGALAAVIERYRPRFVLENGLPHTTRTYERFLRAMSAAGSQRLEPDRRVITLDSVRLVVIPPSGVARWGQNDNSAGLRIEFGEFRATLLGDSERAQQQWWLEHHADLLGGVQVHKSSHHGSRNGDTRELLARLRPDVVVIGVGAANRYGHPHAEALALYREVGARVYRTDRGGTVLVTAQSDGTFRVVSGRPRRPAAPAPDRR